MAACPFCFNRVDTSRLAYQCTNNGPKECTLDTDLLRLKLTNNNLMSYTTFDAPTGRGQSPQCPTCGAGRLLRRACPTCHTAVPVDFVDSDSPMVGIVGSTNSGKTVLMTVLVKQLREVVGKQFRAAVRLTTDNPDGAAGVAAYKAQREDRLFEDGVLPAKTLVHSKAERRTPLVLQWQTAQPKAFGRRGVASTIMSFVDTAGEDLNTLDQTFSLKYVPMCDGLIVTLDPFALPGARSHLNLPKEAIGVNDGTPQDVLHNVTQMLRTELGGKRSKRVKVPIAVVFTKIDAFFPTMDRGNPIMNPPPRLPAYQRADGEAVHEHIRALLREWNADDIDTYMEMNYSDYRFFGVSALGAEPDYASSSIAGGGVQPHRVEDPLLWLMSKEGTVPTS